MKPSINMRIGAGDKWLFESSGIAVAPLGTVSPSHRLTVSGGDDGGGVIAAMQRAIADEQRLVDIPFHAGRVQALEWVLSMLVEDLEVTIGNNEGDDGGVL